MLPNLPQPGQPQAPTELTVRDLANNKTALASYLADLANEGEGEDYADVNPNKLIPQVRMSKDNDLLTVKLDENVLYTGKNLYFLVAFIQGSRALFAPESHPNKEAWKQPICSTGIVDPIVLVKDTAQGGWVMSEDFTEPWVVRDTAGEVAEVANGTLVPMKCGGCRYNLFGSEAVFDSSKPDSKGKACKETRHLFGHLLRKVQGEAPIADKDGNELWWFERDPSFNSFVRLPLGLGSNKGAVEQIQIAAKARGISYTSLVLKLGVRLEVNGSIKYPVLTFEVVGVPNPTTKNGQRAEMEDIKNFIERNRRSIAAVEAIPFG